jgi:transposase
LERRRHRAIALLGEGFAVPQVARRLRVATTSVFRWRKWLADGGPAALAARPVPGRPAKLGPAERERLLALLLQGAVAHGFPNELWTLQRIARLIRREFHVRYHYSQVWRILRSERWSCQVPEKRALQRDETAIAHWKRQRWPAIKTTPTTWGPLGVPR